MVYKYGFLTYPGLGAVVPRPSWPTPISKIFTVYFIVKSKILPVGAQGGWSL